MSIGGLEGTLKLTFSNGDRLELFDSEGYEAYSIQNAKDLAIIV